MKNKIIVDEMPEEALDCSFSEMDSREKQYVVTCRVDGFLCDLERDCYCDKLITLEDAMRNIDIPEV